MPKIRNISNLSNFLESIRPKGLLNICCIGSKSGKLIGRTFFMPRDSSECVSYILKNNEGLYNVYWGVNEPKSIIHGKLRKSDIKHVIFSHIDIDPSPGDYETERRKLLDRVPDIIKKYRPSFVIDSGNGIQVFWKHEEPISTSKGDLINLMLVEQLNGDTGTHNIDRIMRVPYTYNYPTAKKLSKGYPIKPTLSKILS